MSGLLSLSSRRAPGMRCAPVAFTVPVASRLPCAARLSRGLAQTRFAQTIASPHPRKAALLGGTEAAPVAHRMPGLGVIDLHVPWGGGGPHPSPLPEGEGARPAEGEESAEVVIPAPRVHVGGWHAVRGGRALLRRRAAERLADQGHMLFERSEFMWTPPNVSSAGESRSDRRSRVARAVPHAARRRTPNLTSTASASAIARAMATAFAIAFATAQEGHA